jgi:hypothetical protein
MAKYRIAAILMIVHGGLFELGGCLMLIPILLGGAAQAGLPPAYSFIVPYLRDNMNLMLVMGGIFGVMRIVGAIGLLKNRLWGLALAVINCVVTMALMIFMLPAGLLDGLLACSALVLMLIAFFGKKKLSE